MSTDSDRDTHVTGGMDKTHRKMLEALTSNQDFKFVSVKAYQEMKGKGSYVQFQRLATQGGGGYTQRMGDKLPWPRNADDQELIDKKQKRLASAMSIRSQQRLGSKTAGRVPSAQNHNTAYTEDALDQTYVQSSPASGGDVAQRGITNADEIKMPECINHLTPAAQTDIIDRVRALCAADLGTAQGFLRANELARAYCLNPDSMQKLFAWTAQNQKQQGVRFADTPVQPATTNGAANPVSDAAQQLKALKARTAVQTAKQRQLTKLINFGDKLDTEAVMKTVADLKAQQTRWFETQRRGDQITQAVGSEPTLTLPPLEGFMPNTVGDGKYEAYAELCNLMSKAHQANVQEWQGKISVGEELSINAVQRVQLLDVAIDSASAKLTRHDWTWTDDLISPLMIQLQTEPGGIDLDLHDLIGKTRGELVELVSEMNVEYETLLISQGALQAQTARGADFLMQDSAAMRSLQELGGDHDSCGAECNGMMTPRSSQAFGQTGLNGLGAPSGICAVAEPLYKTDILTMHKTRAATVSAARMGFTPSEWAGVPPVTAMQLISHWDSQIFDIMSIYLPKEEHPEFYKGIPVCEGMQVLDRLMGLCFKPNDSEAEKAKQAAIDARQDQVPSGRETMEQYLIRCEQLARAYENYSDWLPDGTRETIWTAAFLRRKILFHTAKRFKGKLLRLAEEEANNPVGPNGQPKKFKNKYILKALKVFTGIQKARNNPSFTEVPKGMMVVESANAAGTVAFKILPLKTGAQSTASEVGYGAAGSCAKGSCDVHPESTTHDNKGCYQQHPELLEKLKKSTKNKKGKRTGRAPNTPRFYDNNKNGDSKSATTYLTEPELKFVQETKFPGGHTGACYKCGGRFVFGDEDTPRHKCSPTRREREKWCGKLRKAIKAKNSMYKFQQGTHTKFNDDDTKIAAMVQKSVQEAVNAAFAGRAEIKIKNIKQKHKDVANEMERASIANMTREELQGIAYRASLAGQVQLTPTHSSDKRVATQSEQPPTQPPNPETRDRPPLTSDPCALLHDREASEPVAPPPPEDQKRRKSGGPIDHTTRGGERGGHRALHGTEGGARDQSTIVPPALSETRAAPKPTSETSFSREDNAKMIYPNHDPMEERVGVEDGPAAHNRADNASLDAEEGIDEGGPMRRGAELNAADATAVSQLPSTKNSAEPLWHVDVSQICTIAEAIGHPETLFLHPMKEEDYAKPLGQVRLIDDQEISWLRNAAPVRMPRHRQDGTVDDSLTRRDLAEAIARMQMGDFRVLAVPARIQQRAFRDYPGTFGTMLRELIQNAHGPPKFCDGHDMARLYSEYGEREQLPKHKPKVIILCAGIGCDALACIAAHYEIVLLVDCCPHAYQELRRKFPGVPVRKLDLGEPGDLAELQKYQGQADATLIGLPCQVSSDASLTSKDDDKRLGFIALAMSAAISLGSRMLIVENVVGFKDNRRKYFDATIKMMEDAEFDVDWYETDALDHLAPTKRRRLFIVGLKLLPEDLKPTRDKLRGDLERQKAARKAGLKTHRDIAETLGPFHDGSMRGHDGVFIHQLRTRPQDKLPHPRIIAIRASARVGNPSRASRYGGRMPTITSKFLQSQRQFSRYKVRTSTDEAPKDRTWLPDRADLSSLQGLAHDTRYSDARRCYDKCKGCFAPTEGGLRSRGRPSNLQQGNIVVPSQYWPILARCMRPLARAIDADLQVHRAAAAEIIGLATREAMATATTTTRKSVSQATQLPPKATQFPSIGTHTSDSGSASPSSAIAPGTVHNNLANFCDHRSTRYTDTSCCTTPTTPSPPSSSTTTAPVVSHKGASTAAANIAGVSTDPTSPPSSTSVPNAQMPSVPNFGAKISSDISARSSTVLPYPVPTAGSLPRAVGLHNDPTAMDTTRPAGPHATPSPTDTSTAAGSTCPRTCPRTGHPEREAATADAAAADGPRVSFGDVDAPLQVSLHELDNTHYPPSSHEQRAARTAQRAAEQKRATRRWENEQQKRRSPAPAEAPRITLDDIERYAVEASNIGIARYLNTKNLARLDRTERSEKLDTFVRTAVSDYIATYVADASSLGTAQVAAHIDAGIDRAIVDSGASSHFVTKKTKLENTRPAAGRRVAVASGDVEPVAEIGDKGVLKNMLKVNSFTRSLISVSALSKLVGMVCFDGNKVYAVSSSGAKTAVSTIGHTTKQGLYSFHFDRLQRHCENHKELLPESGGSTDLATALSKTMMGDISDSNVASAALGDWGEHDRAFVADEGVVAVAHACSDQEAAVALRKFHQTWGHASTKTIALLHDQGVDIGADVSREQILSVQWWCEACMKSKFARKSYNKKSRMRPPPKAKCGEFLVMDIIARKVKSQIYIDGTGKRRGGGKYTLFTMCEVSGNQFETPINKKSDVEQAVKDTIAHVEICMRNSCDFDGPSSTPKVLRITSDRDANITSYKSVIHLLEQRVEQVLTATHASNQTPRLDAAVRRLLTTTTGLLSASGLGLPHWEHAQRFSIAVHNHTPTSANILGRSPMHRWTGVPPRMSIKEWHAFGSEVHVHLRQEQREGGDKLGARSRGGNGRLRYFGPDCIGSRGTSSKGAIIYDTETHRISIERNYSQDPRLEKMKALEETKTKNAEFIVRHGRLPENLTSTRVPTSGPEANADDVTGDETDEADGWTQIYKTSSMGETCQGVARRHGIELEELLNHNLVGDKPPRPKDKMILGTELWLPDAAKLLPQIEPKPSHTTDPVDTKQNLAGRVFKRHITGYGEHYGVVIEGRDGKGRYRILYDDLEGVYTPVYLRQQTIAAGLLPEGTGQIHIEGALQEYDKRLKELAALEEEAETAYAAHASYVREKQNTDELPDASAFLAKLASGGEDAGDSGKPFMLEAEAAFSAIEGRMQEVQDLAAGLVAHLSDPKTAPFVRWPQNESVAKRIFDRAVDKWADTVFENMTTRHEAHLAKELQGIRASEFKTPKTYAEAMKGEFARFWKESIQAELDNLKRHGTYKWVPPPKYRRVHLDSTWVFKAKANAEGGVSRLKSRLTARGFRQIYGRDFLASSAPVGKLVTFRWLLAEMARRGSKMTILDVESAYLQATLKIPQLMKCPKGATPPKPGWVMKLIKSLYGLRNAGREWHELFRKDLLSWGFTASIADPCLFTKRDGKGGLLRVLLFVDDLACFSSPKSDLIEEFMKQIETKYSFSSNDANVYLGLTVTKVGPSTYHLGQRRYIDDMLHKHGLLEMRSVHTPNDGNDVSKADCPDLQPGQNPLQKKYVELLGMLRWIERCTRPDLTATLSMLGKVQCNPGEAHWKKLVHVLRYVATTRESGIVYGGPVTTAASGPLVGYVDSNWGGDGDKYKSRGGYVFCAWQSPIAWASFKGTATALSSCEAEYMAASMATQEAIWLRYLASDMGYQDLRIQEFGSLCEKDYINVSLAKRVHSSEMPFTLFNDNRAAIALSKDPVYHKRSRHIHIRYHFVRDHSNAGHITLAYIPTKENISDIMTKMLKRKTHNYLSGKMLHRLVGKALFTFEGKALEGNLPKPVEDELRTPDLTKYTLLPPSELSSYDNEADMRGVRQYLPTAYPHDHDRAKAEEEMVHGMPGCPCSACCTRRKAIATHLTLRQRSSPAAAAHVRAVLHKPHTHMTHITDGALRGVERAMRNYFRRAKEAGATGA